MSITASIRKRPWLLLGMIFIALLAFLVNPDSMDQMFGKGIKGKLGKMAMNQMVKKNKKKNKKKRK